MFIAPNILGNASGNKVILIKFVWKGPAETLSRSMSQLLWEQLRVYRQTSQSLTWSDTDWYYQFSDTEMTTDRDIKVSLHIAGLLWSDLKHETIRLTFLFWEYQHITLNHSLIPFSIFRTKLCQICCHIGWKCSHARDFPPTGVKECLQELLLQTQID